MRIAALLSFPIRHKSVVLHFCHITLLLYCNIAIKHYCNYVLQHKCNKNL